MNTLKLQLFSLILFGVFVIPSFVNAATTTVLNQNFNTNNANLFTYDNGFNSGRSRILGVYFNPTSDYNGVNIFAMPVYVSASSGQFTTHKDDRFRLKIYETTNGTTTGTLLYSNSYTDGYVANWNVTNPGTVTFEDGTTCNSYQISTATSSPCGFSKFPIYGGINFSSTTDYMILVEYEGFHNGVNSGSNISTRNSSTNGTYEQIYVQDDGTFILRSGFKIPFFLLNDSDLPEEEPHIFDPNITQFYGLEPEDESIFPATTTQITFEANWNISPDDYNSLDTIFSDPDEKVRFTLQITNPYRASWGCTLMDWFLPTGTEYSTSTTVTFPSATCGYLEPNNDYKLIWTLVGSNYWNILGPEFSIKEETYFTVGSTTNAGNIRQALASTTNLFNTSLASTAWNAVSDICNPFSGDDFDILTCVSLIVVPPSSVLTQGINNATSTFMRIAPWGYATRFYNILTTTSTTTLPTISYTTASTSMFGTIDIELDPFGALASADGPLTYVSDQSEQKTIGEIMNSTLDIVIYLMLVFMIIKDLTGINKETHHLSHSKQTS